MAMQMPLIPISEKDCTEAAYRLVQLLSQMDEEEELWKDAKQAHKDTVVTYKKAIDQERATIRRAQLERAEGVTAAQMKVLFAQTKERQEP